MIKITRRSRIAAIAPVLKTGTQQWVRGFESHLLRLDTNAHFCVAISNEEVVREPTLRIATSPQVYPEERSDEGRGGDAFGQLFESHLLRQQKIN